MRIGIACHPSHGGSGVVATELGKSLAKRGHSIHFVTYDVPFRLGRVRAEHHGSSCKTTTLCRVYVATT